MKFFLFGAGASIPFYQTPLTTSYITNEISKKERWEPILKDYWDKFEYHYPISARKIALMVQLLIKKHPQYNFEDIVDVFDKLTLLQWPYTHTQAPEFKQTISDLKALGFLKFHKTKKRINLYFPFLLRCVLLNIFTEANTKRSSKYKDLIEKQHSLFEPTNDQNKIAIVSLNYDDFLYESLKGDFHTGFNLHHNEQEFESFSVQDFINKTRTISFLHGNIRFYNNNFTPKEIVGVKNRINNLGSTSDESNNINNYSFNTFITTGRNKELIFDENPYSIYYQKMAIDISKSEEIIIIGYSFNDSHVNRLLKNYFAIGRFRRIIIVDYYNGQFNSNNLNFLENVTIKNIKELFEANINKDTYEFENLKKNGYGYLFNKILYYSKGYENFLNEYSEVLSSFSDTIYTI